MFKELRFPDTKKLSYGGNTEISRNENVVNPPPPPPIFHKVSSLGLNQLNNLLFHSISNELFKNILCRSPFFLSRCFTVLTGRCSRQCCRALGLLFVHVLRIKRCVRTLVLISINSFCRNFSPKVLKTDCLRCRMTSSHLNIHHRRNKGIHKRISAMADYVWSKKRRWTAIRWRSKGPQGIRGVGKGEKRRKVGTWMVG